MKLIAIDLDGTLLSIDGTISVENRNAIIEAQKKGDKIVISSGRSLHDTKQILHTSGIECPIISGNGAIAFHSDEILQNLYLDAKIIKELIVIIEEKGLYFEIYTNKGVYVEAEGRDLLTREIQRLKEFNDDFDLEKANHIIEIQYEQHGLTYVPSYHDIDYTPLEVYKVFVLSFDQKKLAEIRESLTDREDLSLTTSGLQKLEIGNPESSKGNALKFIANHFEIALENTVAIGDNLNDLPMFQEAGISIAMGNALDAVKEQATYITKDHDEGGVAHALRKFI